MTEFELLCWQLTDTVLTDFVSQGIAVEPLQNLIALKITQLVLQQISQLVPIWISLAKQADEARRKLHDD